MMVGRREGKSIRATAREIGRSPSTVKREPGRNSPGGRRRRASAARRRSDARRLRRRRRGRLGDPALRSLAQARVLPGQRSPERVAGRLALERGRRAVSGPATRRAIARRGPGAPEPRRTARGPAGRLRHRGKRRHRRGEGGAKGQAPPSPARSAGGPPSPRRPTGGRGSRTGTGRRGRRGRGSASAPPTAPGRGGPSRTPAGSSASTFPRAPTSPSSPTGRSRRRAMGPTAGRASAWAGGLPRKPTTQRRCTCSENSGTNGRSRTDAIPQHAADPKHRVVRVLDANNLPEVVDPHDDAPAVTVRKRDDAACDALAHLALQLQTLGLPQHHDGLRPRTSQTRIPDTHSRHDSITIIDVFTSCQEAYVENVHKPGPLGERGPARQLP